jgi:hypothetical protein
MASDASGAGSLGGQRADRHALNQVLMDIMFLGVFWKLRCKLSLRDL